MNTHSETLHTTNFLQRTVTGQQALAATGLVLAMLIIPLYATLTFETRTVLDVNVWFKPIKFCVALSIYCLTLSYYASYLSPEYRNKRLFRLFTQIVIASIAGEMLWLVSASFIGEPSHFNQTHPLLAPVYIFMGALAIILTGMCIAIAMGFREKYDSKLNAPMRLAMMLGLTTTFILTVVLASYMAGGPAQSHTILPAGTTALVSGSSNNTMFFMGWIKSAGDLRVSHFFATHAMHAIPLVGWLFVQILPPGPSKAAIWITTILYSAFVIQTFLQAMDGRSFIGF